MNNWGEVELGWARMTLVPPLDMTAFVIKCYTYIVVSRQGQAVPW